MADEVAAGFTALLAGHVPATEADLAVGRTDTVRAGIVDEADAGTEDQGAFDLVLDLAGELGEALLEPAGLDQEPPSGVGNQRPGAVVEVEAEGHSPHASDADVEVVETVVGSACQSLHA